MVEGRFLEESLPVLIVSYVFPDDVLFHALGFLHVVPVGLEDAVHLGAQADVFRDWAPGTFIRHLPDNLFVFGAVQRVLAWVVGRVV